MWIPEGFAHVICECTGSGLPYGAAFTFGVANVGLQTPLAVADDVANALDAAGLQDAMSANVELTNIHVKFGPNSDGPFVDRQSAILGTAGATGYPGAAALVRKNTALGGRRNSGRFYLPGVPEDGINLGGVLAGTYLADCNAFVGSLLNNLDLRSVPMVLLHDTVGDSPEAVTSLALSPQVATQRRRNRR